MNDKPYNLDRLVRLIITLVLIASGLWLLNYLSDVLIPFAIAFLLAYLINPLVILYQKKIKSRSSASILAILTVVIIFTGIFWITIPQITSEIKSMGKLVHKLLTSAQIAQRAQEKLPDDIWKAMKDYTSKKEFQDFLKNDDFLKITQVVVPKLLPGIKGLVNGAASLIGFLLGITLIFLYLIFLLIDFQRVRSSWKELIPIPLRPKILSFVEDFKQAMNRYFRAQAMIALIVGILHAIGFLIVGLPLAIILGLLVGVLNMVPYLQLITLIPAALLSIMAALESGRDIWVQLIMTGTVFLVIQMIQDLFLVPKIMGKFTGLSPAMILLSLSIWGKLLGFLGLIIAIPASCLCLAYYKQFLDRTEKHHEKSV
ncbi:MAG: AI-2E family transporter [Deltaproteobacteria bacterium]|nr:AI-2E family transporter [Deltaproteobacteria bacterium]